MAAAERDAGTRSGKARIAFENWRSSSGLPVATKPGDGQGASVTWREEIGTDEECMARHGRVADLIIVGRPPADDSGASMVLFETALFDTGKPVMVAPPNAVNGPATGAPAVIFWTGTAEAARAVGAALPLLVAAERVILIASNTGKPTETGLLQDYLAWHGRAGGSEAAVADHADRRRRVGQGAKRDGAGVLVMGAYTQSRLRQLIYGSVTKHVLTNSELPVLMAH